MRGNTVGDWAAFIIGGIDWAAFIIGGITAVVVVFVVAISVKR